MEKKKNIIGDFEYAPRARNNYLGLAYEAIAYVGPTGPGSVTTIPDKVNIDDWRAFDTYGQLDCLRNLDIEKIIDYQLDSTYINLPALTEIVVAGRWCSSLTVEECPMVEKVIFKKEAGDPIEFKSSHGHVTVEYRAGIDLYSKREVAGDNIHAVFGDEVEEVGTICGGHVTLGKGVKKIKALKKAALGLRADTTIAEYELPTRIDFAATEPPVVGSVAPGSMTQAELHVPAGSLDAYMSHPQWGKAGFFVEEGGKTVDKYAAKHKARLKKIQKDREEAAAKAKADKIKAMSIMMHSTLAAQRLAKWNPKEALSAASDLAFKVYVSPLVFDVIIPEDAPIGIWDKIVAKIEETEEKLKQ